jgi:hypothetical protein
MSYWLSEAKTPTGQSRLAAFNYRLEGERVRFGALIINENTPAGTYTLTSGTKRITVVVPPEMATGGGYRCATNELWEIHTDETDPDHQP